MLKLVVSYYLKLLIEKSKHNRKNDSVTGGMWQFPFQISCLNLLTASACRYPQKDNLSKNISSDWADCGDLLVEF